MRSVAIAKKQPPNHKNKSKMKTQKAEKEQATDVYALLPTVAGKSPERVFKGHLKYPKDWIAQYNMLLMDGDTCGDCAHSERCKAIFGGNDANTSCQFHPNRFVRKKPL